jgi:hypothetical protein
MVSIYSDKNMCNYFATRTLEWIVYYHVLSKKTKIVAHGKFAHFHSSNTDEKFHLKWNYLATYVGIFATKR